jgi:hypothetical protein
MKKYFNRVVYYAETTISSLTERLGIKKIRYYVSEKKVFPMILPGLLNDSVKTSQCFYKVFVMSD